MLHALYTLLINTILLLLGAPALAYMLVPAAYLGREHAQAEYRYIEAHGGKRAECPWYCGFLPSAWTAKGLLDWALPLAVGMGFLVYLYTVPYRQGV